MCYSGTPLRASCTTVRWPHRLGNRLRVSIRTVCDLLERRFAEFADLPYQDALSRQQWEELWEAES